MHREILLLAVFATLIKAGPVPYHGAIEQHHHVPRWLNLTALEPSKTEEPTSLISTSSESTISSVASLHESSADGLPSTATSQLALSVSSVRSTSVVVTSSVSSFQANAQEQIDLASVSDIKTSEATSSVMSIGSPSASDSSVASLQTPDFATASTLSSLSFVDGVSSSTTISPPARTSAAEITSKETTDSVAQSETQTTSEAATILADTTRSQSTISAAIIINPIGSSDASLSVSSTSSSTATSADPSTVTSSSTSTPPTDQQIVSASANAIAAAETKSADISAFSISASASAAGASNSASVKYPTAKNGNLAMANGYNQVFKTLGQTSTCDPKDNSAATACIDGQPATCEVDGTYTLESCPQGQSCYAVPKSAGQSGVTIGCYVPSNAAAKLAAGGQSVSIIVSSSLDNVDTANSEPTATASLNTEAVQAVELTSSAAVSSAVTPQSSPAQITKPETTSLQPPPPESIKLVSTNSAPVSPPATAIDTSRINASSSQPTSEATAFSDDSLQSTSISSDHSQQSNPEPAASETTSARGPTVIRHNSASSAAPLVLSFPSDLPSSGPASTTQTSQASTTTRAAPVAEQKNAVPNFDLFSSIEPQAGLSTSATPGPTPGPEIDNGILANNVPAATPSSTSSPTTSADAAGITIVPESNSSGEATVTVTVTMTIHDRNK